MPEKNIDPRKTPEHTQYKITAYLHAAVHNARKLGKTEQQLLTELRAEWKEVADKSKAREEKIKKNLENSQVKAAA